MDRQTLATIIQEGGKLLSGLIHTYATRPQQPSAVETRNRDREQDRQRVSTDETIQYQDREMVKELTLLEGHLQDRCKINDKACDCCEKHPIKLEGLAVETAGMTPDPIYRELADWAKSISPITTESASASGKYEEEYPKLAIKARDFRKAIMPKEVTNAESPAEK